MNKDEASNYKALSSLDSIDPCIYIDGISAEDSKWPHIHMIQYPKVYEWTNDRPHKFGHDHVGHSIIGNEERECGDSRHNQFVSPLEIQHVIYKSQKNSHAGGEKARIVLN